MLLFNAAPTLSLFPAPSQLYGDVSVSHSTGALFEHFCTHICVHAYTNAHPYRLYTTRLNHPAQSTFDGRMNRFGSRNLVSVFVRVMEIRP